MRKAAETMGKPGKVWSNTRRLALLLGCSVLLTADSRTSARIAGNFKLRVVRPVLTCDHADPAPEAGNLVNVVLYEGPDGRGFSGCSGTGRLTVPQLEGSLESRGATPAALSVIHEMRGTRQAA